MTEDVHSAGFKAKLDSAFALGKEEISNASSLMQGRFMQRNFVGIEDSPAYKAIEAIRGQLDELNPGKDGDLMQPRKLLGLIPFGNKLEAYFRKYQSAAEQLKTSMGQLYEARDDMQKDVVDIEAILQPYFQKGLAQQVISFVAPSFGRPGARLASDASNCSGVGSGSFTSTNFSGGFASRAGVMPGEGPLAAG